MINTKEIGIRLAFVLLIPIALVVILLTPIAAPFCFILTGNFLYLYEKLLDLLNKLIDKADEPWV